MKYITETYKPNDYKNFIDYELKTIQKTAIDKCAKDYGVETGETKQDKPKSESNPIVGNWKTEEYDLTIMDNGDLKIEYPDGKLLKGRWKLDGNVFTTTITTGKDKDIIYKVLTTSGDTFIYQTLDKKKKTYKGERIKK